MGKKKPKRPGRWKRGLLSATFAFAVTAPVTVPAAVQYVCPPTDTPSALYVFNEKAPAAMTCTDGFRGRWDSMLDRQHEMLKSPELASEYKAYISKFDDLKGLPVEQQIAMVNARVNADVAYTLDGDENGSHADYWASGVETVHRLKGDCEDFAILKYFALRHLGVPVDRLYIATVNTQGQADGVNHAVLLVNVAPKVADNKNDGGGANYYILDLGAGPLRTSDRSGLIAYGLRNENGYWDPPSPSSFSKKELEEKLSHANDPLPPRGGCVTATPTISICNMPKA